MNFTESAIFDYRPITLKSILKVFLPNIFVQVIIAVTILFTLSLKVYLQTLSTNLGYELAERRNEYLVLNRHFAQLEYQQNLLLQHDRIEKIALNQMDFREPTKGQYIRVKPE